MGGSSRGDDFILAPRNGADEGGHIFGDGEQLWAMLADSPWCCIKMCAKARRRTQMPASVPVGDLRDPYLAGDFLGHGLHFSGIVASPHLGRPKRSLELQGSPEAISQVRTERNHRVVSWVMARPAWDGARQPSIVIAFVMLRSQKSARLGGGAPARRGARLRSPRHGGCLRRARVPTAMTAGACAQRAALLLPANDASRGRRRRAFARSR